MSAAEPPQPKVLDLVQALEDSLAKARAAAGKIARCPECDGGYGTYVDDREGHKAGDKVPHCDPWCSLQGYGRGPDWKHGDAR